MFTGLVQAVGHLTLARAGGAAALTVEHPFGALDTGESIAVDGICLTVASSEARILRAHASQETLHRTTLGLLGTRGVSVNLERALRVGDRVGGHFVAGHVDAVARVVSVAVVGEAKRVVFSLPPELRVYIAPKGSVAVQGVSLTVNEVGEESFGVMLVPHTLTVTTLSRLQPGEAVNLEADVLARYAVQALSVPRDAGAAADPDQGLIRTLEAAGFGSVQR